MPLKKKKELNGLYDFAPMHWIRLWVDRMWESFRCHTSTGTRVTWALWSKQAQNGFQRSLSHVATPSPASCFQILVASYSSWLNCCLHTQTNGTAFASFSSISGASTLDYPFFVLHDLGTYFQSVLKMESLRNKNTWLSFTVHCVTLMNRFPQRPIPLPPGKNLIWVVSSWPHFSD